MTTALDGGEGISVTPRPLFTPGKTRYPMYRRQGGSQGRSGQVRKISLQRGFDPRTVQSVASRHIDYATRPTGNRVLYTKKYTCVKRVMDLRDDKVKREEVDGWDIQHAWVWSEMLIKYWLKSVCGVQVNSRKEILSVTVRTSRKGDLINTLFGFHYGRRRHYRTSYATIRVRIKIFDALSYWIN